jgi:hypothetical protein
VVRGMGSPKGEPTRACRTGRGGECRAGAQGCQHGGCARRKDASVPVQVPTPRRQEVRENARYRYTSLERAISPAYHAQKLSPEINVVLVVDLKVFTQYGLIRH